MGDHSVGLDLGSTCCAVAVRRDTGPAAAAPLGTDGILPATLAFAADGSVLVGEEAEEQASADPARVLRDAVRRVGDGTPIVVADWILTAEDAVALMLAGVVGALADRLGSPPAGVALAHPAGWTDGTVAGVLAALDRHGLPGVTPVPAPLAAVTARRGRSGTVAVVELGTDLTVSVARVPRRGAAELIGRPVGVQHLAGEAFDDLVLAHVRGALGPVWSRLDAADPHVRTAVAQLRRRCRRAKERLSVAAAVEVEVELPGVHARVALDRDRFEELAAPAAAEVVTALGRALEAAEVDPADLDDLVLTGGSAGIPLVARTLEQALGRPVGADPTPLAALGAAALCGVPAPRPARSASPARSGTAAATPEPPTRALPTMREPAERPRAATPRRRPGPAAAAAI